MNTGTAAHPPPSVVADHEWIDEAICGSHHGLFFEPFGERPGARRRREAAAVRMCARCPVQAPCREAGRRNHESGIWGGETEEKRALAGFPPRSVVRRSVAKARRDGLDVSSEPGVAEVACEPIGEDIVCEPAGGDIADGSSESSHDDILDSLTSLPPSDSQAETGHEAA